MIEIDYDQRRRKLGQQLKNGIAIISSGSLMVRSHDTDFPFRQNSNFKYLTGFNEPNSILVLECQEGKTSSTLFLEPKNAMMELWTGKRLGVLKAPEIIGVDQAKPIEEFEEKLPELFLGKSNVFFDFYNPTLREKIFLASKKANSKRKAKVKKPTSFHDISPFIGSMRLIKDQEELQFMKQAAKISNQGHRAAMAMCNPGISEKDIQNTMEYLFKKNGAAGVAYDSIVAGGENALILHYIENNCSLKDGSLLLIDAGSEVNHYASDVTRTFPVNGKYTTAQAEIYQLVLDAQKAAFGLVRPGQTITKIHHETCKVLTQGLIDLKVLKGSLDENMEKKTFQSFYPHGTSHWLGLDVHDQAPYIDESNDDVKLAAGMVLTVEPGLYFQLSTENTPSQFRGIGIRTEDDLLVTETGYENLTASIPKEIKEIEEACRQDYRDFL